MDLRIQKSTNPWNPKLWLAMFFGFAMQLQALPAGANFFASSQQKVKQCRGTEGKVASGPCFEQDKIAPFTQQNGQALNQNNEGQGITERAGDVGAQAEANKAPVQQANGACQEASSGCQKECGSALQQIKQDHQKCVSTLSGTPQAAQIPSMCDQPKQQLEKQAQGSKQACKKDGEEFKGNSLGALAALAALAAAAMMSKKKSDGSAEEDALACEWYDPKTGILKGYENSYTPPATVSEAPEPDAETDKSTELKEKLTGGESKPTEKRQVASNGSQIPKSAEGRPLYEPKCKTADVADEEPEPEDEDPALVCEKDIDCLCKSPNTADQKEVCGCYSSTTKKAVVSPFCNTVMEAHPDLQASIAEKYEAHVKASEATDETSGSNAYASDFVFNEEEQREIARELQDGPPTSASGSANFDNPASSSGDSDRASSFDSDLAGNGDGMGESLPSGSDIQFSLGATKRAGSQGGDLSELAGRIAARSPAAASVRQQNGINPAHGKGVFQLINEAYKKQSRNLDQ